MGKIFELPALIANQIAAGEVIDAPASAIKELLENAIDAQSSNIEVRIKDAGLREIIVKDDGQGMDKADLSIAIKRYATSKLRKAEDLENVLTYGFRGEALSSIASISNFTIASKEQGEETGNLVQFSLGNLDFVRPFHNQKGTTVVVKDLFYNLPARLKFLRSKRSEYIKIENLIKLYSYIYPEINFRLFKDDELIIDSINLRDDLAKAIYLLGSNTKGYLYKFNKSSKLLQIAGFYASPLIARRDNRGIKIFLNKRPIEDKKLENAVLRGYRGLLEIGQRPMIAINISIDPGHVDVNVHPRKAEVRFKDEKAILDEVAKLLADAISQTPWLNEKREINSFYSYSYSPSPGPSTVSKRRDEGNSPRPLGEGLGVRVMREAIEQAPKLLLSESFQSLKYIGQILNTYLLLEGEQGLVAMDQHAAHERVMFEKIKKQKKELLIPQSFLLPFPLRLSREEFLLAEEYQQELLSLGLEIDFIAEGALILRSAPSFLHKKDPQSFLPALLINLESLGHPKELEELYDHVAATMACHSAIRSGQKMSREEVLPLLIELDHLDINAHCPHGRPVVKSFSENEIKKWFHRT